MLNVGFGRCFSFFPQIRVIISFSPSPRNGLRAAALDREKSLIDHQNDREEVDENNDGKRALAQSI